MKLKRFVIYLCAFIGPLGGNAVLVLIPTLKEAFLVEEAEVMLAISLFMLPFAVGQLFTSAIARTINYKNTMALGYLIYGIGSLVSGAAPGISVFLAGRVIQGIGFALVSPVTVAILGELTEPRTRGRHMGLLNAAIGGGLFLGPIIAGIFAGINWRLTFYSLGIITLVVAQIFIMVFGTTRFEKVRNKRSSLAAEFIDVLRSPKVILLCAAGFWTFFAFIGVMAVTVDYISRPPLNLTEYQLGIILAASGIAQIVLALPGGLVVDWIGRIRTGYMGFITGTVISILFLFANSYYYYIMLAVLLGFASVLIWAVLVTLSVEVMPEKKIYVTSIFNSTRFFGFAVSPVVLVFVYTGPGISMVYWICAFAFAINIVFLYLMTRY